MLRANFLILFYIFLLNETIADAKYAQIDCKENELNYYCECNYEDTQDFLEMNCKSILEASQNRLPSYSVGVIKVTNAYDRWPSIPTEYKKTLYLFLSENQIDSIGDLTYLDNLQYLNLSHNKISKIDKSLTKLKELFVLDLSYNLLDEIHFDDLVIDCDNDTFDPNKDQIFSKLKILLLNGNRIKQIYNFDLAFVGMPLLSMFSIEFNNLTRVEVTGLSQQSLNVIKKAKQALETNATYMELIAAPSQYGYYFGFNANSIINVHFNFHDILNEIFVPFKIIFLTRFLSISLFNENGKIICDCNIFNDLNFLIDQLVNAFSSKKIPESFIENFLCYKKDSNSSINLFTLINHNSVKMSDFCDSSSNPTDVINSSTASNVSSKNSTVKVNMKNSSLFSKPSLIFKLIIATTTFTYCCLF